MCNSKDLSKFLCLLIIIFALIKTKTIEADEEASRDPPTEPPAPIVDSKMEARILIDPLMKFSCNLFSQAKDEKKNAILSPLSIHQALNMVLMGSDLDSETQRELIEALGYPTSAASLEEQVKYHGAYLSIIGTLKKASSAAIAQLKAIEERKKQESSENQQHYFHGDARPREPIIDFWNMIITKNEAKLNSSYLEKVTKYYNSSLEQISDGDSESNKTKKSQIIGQVNGWAKEAGFESDLMKPSELNGDFRALLLTAVRVQASWFEKFHLADGKNIFLNYGLKDQLVGVGKLLRAVELEDASYLEFRPTSELIKYKYLHQTLMEKHSAEVKQLKDLNFQAIGIRLVGGVEYIMLEPFDKGSGQELSKLTNELLKLDSNGHSKLSTLLQLLDSNETLVEIDKLEFPAFKFSNDLALNGPLKRLGIKRAFSDQLAQLSSITEDKLYISEAKHQAMIELNEFGLKAAALTSIKMSLLSAKIVKEPIRLKVDSPFMFLVRYESLPLFVGQLVKV